MKTESAAWAALMASVREPLAIYATPSSGGMLNLRVSLRQRVPGDARNAIAAIFGSHAEAKHVFAFDPDIDVFSDEETDWALATRFQADLFRQRFGSGSEHGRCGCAHERSFSRASAAVSSPNACFNSASLGMGGSQSAGWWWCGVSSMGRE